MSLTITDGALYFSLNTKFDSVPYPAKLNVLYPKIIQEIHEEFVLAGSEIITTNTFDANIWKYSEEELNKYIIAGVNNALVIKEKYPHIKIAFTIGPSEELIEPYGLRKTEDATINYQKIIELVEDTNIDYIYLESFTDIRELVIAIKAIKKISNIPLIASMTYKQNGKTVFETTPQDQAKVCKSYDVDIIGINCGIGVESVLKPVLELLKYTNKPVWVKTSPGKPKVVEDEIVFNYNLDKYLRQVEEMVLEGISYLGGCCGTTPQLIKILTEFKKKED